MPTNTYVALDKVTLTNSTTTYIEFLNISQSYTDLLIVFDGTATGATAYPTLNVGNNSYDTTNSYSRTVMIGNGTTATSTRDSNQPNITVAEILTTGRTNLFIHFMNYSNTTTNKTFLMRNGNASNKTEATVGLWRSTSAINRIKLETYAGTFTSGSTFSLYGIAAEGTSPAPKATGGAIYSDSTYYYHVFGATGTFTPSVALTNVEYVVVAGGGGGGGNAGAPGGAGGYRSSVVGEMSGGGASAQSRISMSNGTAYTITVGAGGAGQSVYNNGRYRGAQGSSSSIAGSGLTTISCTGGGSGTSNGLPVPTDPNGGSGGSGGAGAAYGGGTTSGSGGAGTTGEGYAGGSASAGGTTFAIGGGGGAGAAGQSVSGSSTAYIAGNGGIGIQTVMAIVTGAGGDSGYLAGGGIGGDGTSGTRGLGGGGINNQNGYANSGGGAGGGANGGSGVVIIRYAKA